MVGVILVASARPVAVHFGAGYARPSRPRTHSRVLRKCLPGLGSGPPGVSDARRLESPFSDADRQIREVVQ